MPCRPDRHAVRLRVEHDPAAVEASLGVVAERSGQQPGCGEHLESVADADQRAAVGDEVAQRVAEPEREVEGQHAAGAERVAVAEAAGDHGQCRRRRAAPGCSTSSSRARSGLRRRRVRGASSTSLSRLVPGPAITSARTWLIVAPPVLKASTSWPTGIGSIPGTTSSASIGHLADRGGRRPMIFTNASTLAGGPRRPAGRTTR